MGKIKAYVPRSRKGCLTCKKRRVKCDETHPKCTRCDKLNLECEYQQSVVLTWEEDAHKRGITFGRSLIARAQKLGLNNSNWLMNSEWMVLQTTPNVVKRRQDYFYVNINQNDFIIRPGSCKSQVKYNLIKSSVVTQKTLELHESAFLGNPFELKDYSLSRFFFSSSESMKLDEILWDSFSLPEEPSKQIGTDSKKTSLSLNAIEKELIDYFVEFVCPNCVCCEIRAKSYVNPYSNLIVPLVWKSHLVMKVVVIAAAKQLVLLGHSSYESIAQSYTHEVLTELPKLIDRKYLSEDWDDVYAIVLMLCFVEISVSCNDSWLILLNDAKEVLKNSCKQKKLSPIGKFFIRYFISHEVMGATAWVTDITDDPYIEELKQDYDTNIDLMLGCSPYLISLIHRVSVIGKCFEGLDLETDAKNLSKEFLKHAKDTERLLIELKQEAVGEFYGTEKENVVTIAEIKRLAALLYLSGRVYSEYEILNLEPSAISDSKNYKMKMRKLFSTLPKIYMSLLWPIFILGVLNEDDEDERWFILETLTQMGKSRELQTVKTARDVILSVWKEKDLGLSSLRWKDLIAGKASTISLA